jgi:hypothetical protein
MNSIENYKKRFNMLMESSLGDVKPLLNEDDASIILSLSFNLKFNINPTTKQKDYLGFVYYNMPINTTGPEGKGKDFKGNLYAGISSVSIGGQSYTPSKETVTPTNVTGYFPMDKQLIMKFILPYVNKGQQLNIKDITVTPKEKSVDGKIVNSNTPHKVNLTVTEQQSQPTQPIK